MNNQYLLKISVLKHVGSVSVNSKPDHPPLAKPLENFFNGRIPWAKKFKTPIPRGIFLNYSQYNMKEWDKTNVKLHNFIIFR